MFFERFHDGDKITVVPGLPDHLGKFRAADQDFSGFRLRLPSAEELEPRKVDLFKKGFAQIAYVKLHGSQGWLSHDGSDVMVIGTQKHLESKRNPILKWYFSLFEEVINRRETRLVIVGYGFGDTHINECIVKAIAKGLKLYVISAQSPQDFKNQFKTSLHGRVIQKPFGDELWEGLVQYWPMTLKDFYYENVIPPGDLTPRGRALFQSLGLT